MDKTTVKKKSATDCSGPGLGVYVSEKLLGQCIMASSFGYVITDRGQKNNPIVFVNEAFEEITGYGSKEVLGKNCRFLLGKDRKQGSRERIREAMDRGRPCTAVLRNYRKDGTLFHNELTVSPIHDQSGRVTHFVWMQRDVTHQIEEKERMTTLIADKERRFYAYMENANEALWRVDFEPPISLDAPESQQVRTVFDNGVYKEVNDVAARIYGYTDGR